MSRADAPLRVLELCHGLAGPLCGRHLALLGADVRRAEGTMADPARDWGRRAPGALFALLAEGKTTETTAAPEGADVVLADEGRLDPATLPDPGAPRLVVLFERETLADGAYAGAETVVQAALGLTDYVSDRWTAPARTGADIASVTAGVAAVQAVLAWHLGSPPPGWSVVRVSALRALAALKTVIWAARSAPDAWSGSHVVARDRRADCGYRVDDGWITIDFPHDAAEAWRGFCAALGVGGRVPEAGERWWETVGWGDDVDEARPLYEAALAGLSRDEACEAVRRHGGSSVPFNAPAEVLAHPQTAALKARPDRLPWRVLQGATEPALVRPRTNGARGGGPPLEGLRILDFGIGGVGPFAAALLAQLGAQVIKIEAPNEFIHAVRPTADGLATTYSALNVGKRSADLNLKRPEDLARARALVGDADVVMENFRPGAMERLGLGYADVARLNPAAVYVSASGFGSVGPMSRLPCTDPHIQAFGGWALSNADASGTPRRTRYYAMLDLVTSMAIVEATLAALHRRAAGGAGGHVEIAMLEAIVHLHVSRWLGVGDGDGPEMLYAPDGIFATTDGHVALAVESDAQWEGLLRALGRPAALDRPAWATNAGRLAAQRELEAALAPVLAGRSSRACAQLLAREGVPAARLQQDDDAVLRRDLWEGDVLRPLIRRDRPPLAGGGPPWGFEPPLEILEAPTPGDDPPAWELPLAPHRAWSIQSIPE